MFHICFALNIYDHDFTVSVMWDSVSWLGGLSFYIAFITRNGSYHCKHNMRLGQDLLHRWELSCVTEKFVVSHGCSISCAFHFGGHKNHHLVINVVLPWSLWTQESQGVELEKLFTVFIPRSSLSAGWLLEDMNLEGFLTTSLWVIGIRQSSNMGERTTQSLSL